MNVLGVRSIQVSKKGHSSSVSYLLHDFVFHTAVKLQPRAHVQRAKITVKRVNEDKDETFLNPVQCQKKLKNLNVQIQP